MSTPSLKTAVLYRMTENLMMVVMAVWMAVAHVF